MLLSITVFSDRWWGSNKKSEEYQEEPQPSKDDRLRDLENKGSYPLFCVLQGMTGLEQRKLCIFIPDSELSVRIWEGLIRDHLWSWVGLHSTRPVGNRWGTPGSKREKVVGFRDLSSDWRGKRKKSRSFEIRLGVAFHFLRHIVWGPSVCCLGWSRAWRSLWQQEIKN